MLADILPTGYEVGVLNGNVKPGDMVAVVGAGPDRAGGDDDRTRLSSPARIIAIDLATIAAGSAPSTSAPTRRSTRGRGRASASELTGGLGADVAIEAVGVPATFELCTELVRPGGHVANIGVHGKPATLHLEDLWIKNVTITTGLVDTSSTPTLLRLIAEGRLDPLPLATHHFKLDEMLDAYEVFGNAGETDALKVVLSAQ